MKINFSTGAVVSIAFLLLFGLFTFDYESRPSNRKSGQKLDALLAEVGGHKPSFPEMKKDHLASVPQWGALKTAGVQPVNADSKTVLAKPIPAPPAKDKKDGSKKKKVAKKNKKRIPVIYVMPRLPDRPPSIATGVAQVGGGLAGTPAKPAAPSAPHDLNNPRTLDDWETLILKPGSYQALNKLISKYQTRQIPEDWFYQIVDKLMSSSSKTHHTYGLVALSSSPSFASFERLSAAKITDPDNDHRLIANSSMNQYQSLDYLSVLTEGLQASEKNTQIDAVSLLKRSAETNLEGDDEGTRGRGTVTPASGQNTRYYQSLLTLVRSLTQSPDATLAASARSTLNTLQTLLGNKSDQVVGSRQNGR